MDKKQHEEMKQRAALESAIQDTLYAAMHLAQKLGDHEKSAKILAILKSGF